MVLGLQTSNQSIVPNVACAKISCMSTYIANLCQSLDELVFSACTTEIASEYAHVEAKPTSCRRRMELNVLESGECQAAHIRMEDGSVIDVFDDDILDVRASVKEAVQLREKNIRSSSELQLCRVAVYVAPGAQGSTGVGGRGNRGTGHRAQGPLPGASVSTVFSKFCS